MGFNVLLAPHTTSIIPPAIKIRIMTSIFFSLSLRKIYARITHAIGDSTLTTPIMVSGITLVQYRLTEVDKVA